MILCNFCTTSILESSEPWGYHQKSYKDLEASSAGLCIFCRCLHEEAAKTGRGEKADWPSYRWTIRRLGHIRESEEAVVVTFRPLPCAVEGAGGVKLRDRSFYLVSEQNLGHVPDEAELPKSTNSEHSSPQINKWLQHCLKNHPDCNRRRHDTFVPHRVLAVGRQGDDRVRLVDTRGTNIKGPYVTLSHRWGTNPNFLKLEVSTIRRFLSQGISMADLTLNFQQAIAVARCLGVEYMWIDSLCIVQGRGGDFAVEGDLMHKIYRNTYCNIAAADASDWSEGLFRQRDPKLVVPDRYVAAGNSAVFGRKAWRVLPKDLWDVELLGSSVYTRAWVFQERMLAPRIVHFAKTQLFWDCASMSACEALPSGLPQPLDDDAGTDRHWRGRLHSSDSMRRHPRAGPNDDSLEGFWKSAVLKYTSCDLTKGSDKLTAIWGIAKLLRDALDEEYAAGLWEGNLAEQLAWRVVECTVDERPQDQSDNPTWSWASMSGRITVQDRVPEMDRDYVVSDHHGEPILFELQPSSITGQGRDLQPELGSKSITIQAHIGYARLWYDKSNAKWRLKGPAGSSTEKVLEVARLEVFPDVKPKSGPTGLETCFFVLAWSSISNEDEENDAQDTRYTGVGLTMEPLAAEKHHYRRTGAFHFRDLDEKQWQALIATYQKESVSKDEWDAQRGLKFWLD